MKETCAFCQLGDDGSSSLGRLLGPVGIKGLGEARFHHLCALWSPQVCESPRGGLLNVRAEIRRGKLLRCAHCSRRGATLGCRVGTCSRSYHVVCAEEAGATFFPATFQMACAPHSHQFGAEEGIKRLPRPASGPQTQAAGVDARMDTDVDGSLCLQPAAAAQDIQPKASSQPHPGSWRLSRTRTTKGLAEVVASPHDKAAAVRRVLLPLIEWAAGKRDAPDRPRLVLVHGHGNDGALEAGAAALAAECASAAGAATAEWAARGSDRTGAAALGVQLMAAGAAPCETCPPEHHDSDRAVASPTPHFVVTELRRGDGAAGVLSVLDRAGGGSTVVVLLAEGVPGDVPCALRRHLACQLEILPPSAAPALLRDYWSLPRAEPVPCAEPSAPDRSPARSRVCTVGAAMLDDARVLVGRSGAARAEPACPSLVTVALLAATGQVATLSDLVSILCRLREHARAASCTPEPDSLAMYQVSALCEALDDAEWRCQARHRDGGAPAGH